MINPIRLKADCRLQSLLTRIPYIPLWIFARESTDSGIITLLIPEILTLFNISLSTLYRWLKEGKKAGAFRYYKKTGKFTIYIVLGSKRAVTENLGLTDWGAVTEQPLWTILEKNAAGQGLRQETTLHHAHWMEKRSVKAAQKQEQKRVQSKHHQKKPYKPKFNYKPKSDRQRNRAIAKGTAKVITPPEKNATAPKAEPKKLSGATTKATPQYKQPTRSYKRERKRELPPPIKRKGKLPPPIKRKGKLPPPIKRTAFSRNHIPTGASQKEIAESLGVSERTVRRHLSHTKRIQVMYKVNPIEGQAALFEASETWGKSPIFKRQGEYYRYGCNLYDLNFVQKSEFTQRLKYKFCLFKKISALRKFNYKNTLLFEEFKELFMEFNLDQLDEYCLLVLWYYRGKCSFKEFLETMKYELRMLNKWIKGKLPNHQKRHAPLFAGR